MIEKDSVILRGVWNGLELAPRGKGNNATSCSYYEIKARSFSAGYRKQYSNKVLEGPL